MNEEPIIPQDSVDVPQEEISSEEVSAYINMLDDLYGKMGRRGKRKLANMNGQSFGQQLNKKLKK
jgi:hypothetical protein